MKAAVLGSPIAHSLSPALHLAAYQAMGLDGWSYRAIECDETRLAGLLAACGPEWAGLSLTMPLKRTVLGLLDDAEPLVEQVGAANTVVFDAGLRRGHNTDVPGMISALGEAGLATPSPVLILGAGATACSALVAVRALGVIAATVAARDARRAGGLLAVAERIGVTVRLVPFGEPGEPAPGLLISTAPAGAADRYAQRIRLGTLAPGCLLDVVYHPWPTALAAAAQQAGLPVASGFTLLLHQAARQVELMTGKPAPVGAMRAAGLAAFTTKR